MIKDRHDEDRYSSLGCYTCHLYETNSGPERIAMTSPSCKNGNDVRCADDCQERKPMTEEEIAEVESLDDDINNFHCEYMRVYF